MKRLLSALFLCLLTLPAQAVTQQTLVGNAAYTILATDQNVSTSVAFTAARTWTLPSAGATCIGQSCQPPAYALRITDTAGAITATNTLTIAPASGETINGNAANLVLSAAKAQVTLIPTSGSNWQAIVEGDYIESTVLVGAAVSLTTNTPANITSLSLSQGDWECRATISRTMNAATSVTRVSGSISTTTATMGTQGVEAVNFLNTAANVVGATGIDTKIGPTRLNLAATTTVFLVANDIFTVSTNAGFGQLACRRAR